MKHNAQNASAGSSAPRTAVKKKGSSLPIISAMEARLVETVPEGPEWEYEPKWDGFRCIVYKHGTKVDLVGKSGKSLARYFPEIVEAFAKLKSPEALIIDGELIIKVDGRLSFDALQMRLHPAASRIERLAKEIPARFVAFDLLFEANYMIADRSFAERREILKIVASKFNSPLLILTETTRDLSIARKWLKGRSDTDGIVAKRLDLDYRFGERAMLKIKRMRTADCVVGGFRYGRVGRLVGSLLLGLYDAKGLLQHVGFTSSIATEERLKLTQKLEKLRTSSSFTGDAPGGPSRWSTERSAQWVAVRPKLVAEVRYDHVTAHRFRHGTKFLRWRPDKAPSQCLIDQIE